MGRDLRGRLEPIWDWLATRFSGAACVRAAGLVKIEALHTGALDAAG
jgi:hypothetical protein